MSALGEFLIRQRWLSAEELSEALLEQQRVGGRLGTTLLERGYLSEDLLLRALTEQQKAPGASATDLLEIPLPVITLLPANLASRHLAIPFRAFGDRVDVALAKIDDRARTEELAATLGKSLRLHVAIEARLYHALETYYGVHCPQRFRILVQRLDGASGIARRSVNTAPKEPIQPAEVTSQSSRRPGRFIRRLEAPAQQSIPLSDTERRVLEPAVDVAAEPRPAITAVPSGVESSPEGLATARSGGEIGRILLASASEHFVHTLLFRVARRQVSGWLGSGPGLDLSWLRSYSVGLRQPTVFREVERGATFRGALAANPHHTSLARCWGGELERECLVLPLRVRGRLVGALYGDRGAPALGSIDTAAVERLAAKAGLAFERLILDRKLRN